MLDLVDNPSEHIYIVHTLQYLRPNQERLRQLNAITLLLGPLAGIEPAAL